MKVWRLIVWGASPEHAGVLARLRMIPAKGKTGTFWREDKTRVAVVAAIDVLKSVGLHGIAKRFDRQTYKAPSRKPVLATSREGFGSKLNAAPIKGSWRRKARRR